MSDKEIRFIDSSYRELFRIPDGSKINITHSDGEKLARQCKYIDDYHFEIGKVGSNYGNVYHICQFAEIMEHNGNTYEPMIENTYQLEDVKYVEQTYGDITADKFFKTDFGITEVYYNPDADAGGQIVYIEISDDMIREAAEKTKNPKDFFSHIESMGCGYLIDVGTPEFRSNLKSFIERKADFEGCTKKTMQGLMKAAGIKPKSKDMER